MNRFDDDHEEEEEEDVLLMMIMMRIFCSSSVRKEAVLQEELWRNCCLSTIDLMIVSILLHESTRFQTIYSQVASEEVMDHD
jgi:hypothetical protein